MVAKIVLVISNGRIEIVSNRYHLFWHYTFTFTTGFENTGVTGTTFVSSSSWLDNAALFSMLGLMMAAFSVAD